MRSLRGRLTLIVAGLALVAVVSVTVAVAFTTSDAMEDTLAEQREAEDEIVGALTEQSLVVETWPEAQPLVDELGEEFQARIVLTEKDGRRLLDTGAGALPPLAAVIDPVGRFAKFTDDASFDIPAYYKTLATCFEAAEIPYKVDKSGKVFVGDDDDGGEMVKACYAQAAEPLISGAPVGVVEEPALLFIGFSVAPSIPWFLVGMITAVVIAVAVFAAALMTRVVTRPLNSLTSAARSIREGNLDVRVDAASPTEVAELATSFNDMAEELARAEARRKQLTADVGHELRSPLTNILAHLDAIDDGVTEPTPDEVRIITSEAVRLAHLVDDLQTLAAIDEQALRLNLAPEDLCGVLDVAIEARRRRALDKEVAVLREGACDEKVGIDRIRFDQMIGNLLDNALEYTPDGGTVKVLVIDGAEEVKITVSDTGPGIDPDFLPYVFDRLSRADPSRHPGGGGRGLGLAIARGVARSHGGDIAASNNDDDGASFIITIPRGNSDIRWSGVAP